MTALLRHLDRLMHDEAKVRILTGGTSPLIGWEVGRIVDCPNPSSATGMLNPGWVTITLRTDEERDVERQVVIPVGAIQRIEEVGDR